ncbi:MAG: FtsX-like permease family protein, partial [Chitinophagaceae bacterium]
QSGGRIDIMMMLGIIGFFVLIIACINFMNLATAQSERRAREVGVRKVLGAFRKQVIFQFLSEAFLITFFAMIVGIFLAKMFLPVFYQFSQKNLAFDFGSKEVWLALLCIGLFTGLVAGSYPAFFLSRFKPVLVLKGVLKSNKGGSVLRKGLVTFQFVISIFLIITTIVIFNQLKYVQDRPLGYNQENLIDIPARGDMKGKFQLVKNELLQIPNIKNVSGGNDNLVQFGGATDGIEWPGKTPDQNFPVTISSVQYDWIKTAGLNIAAGRDFDPQFGNDVNSCLVNQTAVKAMKLKEPVIGTKLGDKTIVGVVQDFVYNNPTALPRPMLLYLTTGAVDHIFVRVTNDDQWKNTIAEIEKAIKKTNPDYPFEYYFTTELYQKKFTGIKSTSQLLTGVGILAIFISCLGLFGLSAFLAERRGKEIGIRKVLGANASKIWFTLSKDFLKPVLLAFVIASPLTAFVMQKLLSRMDYHITLSWWMFVIAGVMAVSIAVLTVSFQGVKAALKNPVKALRAE